MTKKGQDHTRNQTIPLSPCCHHLYSLSTLLAAGPSEHFINSSPAHFAVTGQMSAVLAQLYPSLDTWNSSLVPFLISVFLAFGPFGIRLSKVNCYYSHHQVHVTMAAGLFQKAPYRSAVVSPLLSDSDKGILRSSTCASIIQGCGAELPELWLKSLSISFYLLHYTATFKLFSCLV